MSPITGLDHVAYAVARNEEMLAFYRRLGFTVVLHDGRGLATDDEDAWRAEGNLLWAVVTGPSKIFMIPWERWQAAGYTPATLRAPEAHPGTMDVCWVWEGTVESAQQHLADAGAEIIDGPVERAGGAGGGRQLGTSLYFRDPDENLLELIIY
jgi:catechol 2,3-dioxygenase-like lactoylglutathione lyase family enzyme